MKRPGSWSKVPTGADKNDSAFMGLMAVHRVCVHKEPNKHTHTHAHIHTSSLRSEEVCEACDWVH